MNKKQAIRLNENQLRRIVTESVRKVLKESLSPEEAAYQLNVMLGTINDELKQGGEMVTQKEIEELYNLSSIVYQYFEN